MAFKTDSIKLKNYADDADRDAAIASPANGDLAVNNGSLQIYNGSWGAVGPAGGATQLSGLSDVSDSPASAAIDDVGVVFNDGGTKRLRFEKISLTSIDAGSIMNVAERNASFTDTDNQLMTAAAIQDHIQAIAPASFNYASSATLANHVVLQTGSKYNDVLYAITGDPNGKHLQVDAPENYAANAVITIMNGSSKRLNISEVGSPSSAFDFIVSVLDPPACSTFYLEPGQKAILIKTSSADWNVIIASI